MLFNAVLINSKAAKPAKGGSRNSSVSICLRITGLSMQFACQAALSRRLSAIRFSATAKERLPFLVDGAISVTHTHVHTHTHGHTHIHARAHTHTHTRTHTRTHGHTYTRAHTWAHTGQCAHGHTHARTQARAHIHTCAPHTRIMYDDDDVYLGRRRLQRSIGVTSVKVK